MVGQLGKSVMQMLAGGRRLLIFQKNYSTSTDLYLKHLQSNFRNCSNQLWIKPSTLRAIGRLRTSICFQEKLEEKDSEIPQFSDLIQPEEYKNVFKKMKDSYYQELFDKMTEDLHVPERLNMFKTHLNNMMLAKLGHPITENVTAKRAAVIEGLIIMHFFDKCKTARDKEFYFSTVYLLEENIMSPMGVGLLAKCVECMVECGWSELGKRNVRSVFDGGCKLNTSAILKLMQVYFKQGDLEFVTELMASLDVVMMKKSKTFNIEVDKSFDELMQSLIRDILDGDSCKHERKKLVRDLLFLYQRDEGPHGWCEERAKELSHLLLK